jgi:hypothetical protein
VPRTSWIDHVGEQLDWESNGTDEAGLTNLTSTYDGTTILDDDIDAPFFANPSSDGNILDSDSTAYRLQMDWDDNIGISEVQFRYSNDTVSWSLWDDYTGVSGNTYSYDIPRSEWIKSVGSDIYWQSKANDTDNDRPGDSLENTTTTLLGGSISDDDSEAPTYTLLTLGDIYDDNTSDYMIQLDWFDNVGLSQIEFRYRYNSDPWSLWDSFSGNSGDTYWYMVPRTEWINQVGSKISWESRAGDNDNDRTNDALSSNTGTHDAGWILDDDTSPPILEYYVDEYDAEEVSYSIDFRASDASGWTVNVEYYFSDTLTVYTLSNSTVESGSVTVTVEIGETELEDHTSDTIYWRYMIEDNDNDRIGDSMGTTWSSWLLGLEIDLSPPTTNAFLSGVLGSNASWFVDSVGVTFQVSDAGGVNHTFYRVNKGTWTLYTDTFGIDESGIHEIEYYSVDKAGNTEQVKNSSVMIDKINPVANANDLVVSSDSSVVLDGSLSEDNICIQSYEWRIERDGTLIKVLEGMVQSYRFPESGNYEITLKVTDYAGNTDETTLMVDVSGSWTDWIFILLIIIIIVIVIALLLYFLYRRRRNNNPEGLEEESEDGQEEE